MNPLSPGNIVATVFTGALLLLIAFIAAFVFFTQGDGCGDIHWPPHWPDRYPASKHRDARHRPRGWWRP